MSGAYASLSVVPEDAEVLADYVREHGIQPLPPEHMHLTLLRIEDGDFDFSAFIPTTPVIALPTTGRVRNFSFELVDHGALISLEPGAAARTVRQSVLAQLGRTRAKHPFKPHVSLSYSNCRALSGCLPPLDVIRFCGLTIGPVDRTWYRQFLSA